MADILWRNKSDNALQIWRINANSVTERVDVFSETGKRETAAHPWHIVAVGRFPQPPGPIYPP